MRSQLDVLRNAGRQDLEALYRLEILCFRERRFRRDHIDWILRNDRARTLVEDAGHGIMGSIMLLFEGSVCRILSVAVAPDERRKGLGTRMMEAAEAICRRRACTTIRLEVSTQNLSAIEFYRRLGYRTDGVLYDYYSWGDDAYSMHKPVSADPVTKAAGTPVAE